MRTFHIGGTASRVIEQSYIESRNKGLAKYHSLKIVPAKKPGQFIVLNRNGQISIDDSSGRELERHTVPQGAVLLFPEGSSVDKKTIFVRWDPYTVPILTEVDGKVRYEDIKEGITMKEELDPSTKIKNKIIIEHKGDFHPEIVIHNQKNEVLALYPIPSGAVITVDDKESITAGDVLAKTPRQITKTKDITGGLPRVAELFEARKPKDPSIISEIDGAVEFGESKKGQKRVIIKSATGMKKEYIIPHGKHLNVYKGDKVFSGQQLIDGPIVPQDILRVSGEKVLQEYLLNEIQEVYRLQGVKINDKHIEVIIRQMLKKVKIEDPGDASFVIGEQVDRIKFKDENERILKKKQKPASATPVLLGITKASLTTDSFVSAASFQETTRILTDAASSGKVDYLLGLKENIIMGHLIPAGTGFTNNKDIELVKNVFNDKGSKNKKKSKSEEKEQGRK